MAARVTRMSLEYIKVSVVGVVNSSSCGINLLQLGGKHRIRNLKTLNVVHIKLMFIVNRCTS